MTARRALVEAQERPIDPPSARRWAPDQWTDGEGFAASARRGFPESSGIEDNIAWAAAWAAYIQPEASGRARRALADARRELNDLPENVIDVDFGRTRPRRASTSAPRRATTETTASDSPAQSGSDLSSRAAFVCAEPVSPPVPRHAAPTLPTPKSAVEVPSGPTHPVDIPAPGSPVANARLASQVRQPADFQATVTPAQPANFQATLTPAQPANFQATLTPAQPANFQATLTPAHPANFQATLTPAHPANFQATVESAQTRAPEDQDLHRPRPSATRRVISTISMAAVVGCITGLGISNSAAATGLPSSTSTASIRGLVGSTPVSRSLSRTPLAATTVAPTSPADGDVTGNGSAIITDAELASASDTFTPTPTRVTTPPPSPVPPPAPVVPLSVDGIMAPGQRPAVSVAEALARARAMTGSQAWGDLCLALVADFYGYTSSGQVGAQQAAYEVMEAGQMHTDLSTIPLGALIWYDGRPAGNPYGHVAMYAGNGMVYSNGAGPGGAVGLIPLTTPAKSWGEPIMGWSGVWLPHATK